MRSVSLGLLCCVCCVCCVLCAACAVLCSDLLGEGGVCKESVGTPVVGVTWVGSWLPCVKLRLS